MPRCGSHPFECGRSISSRVPGGVWHPEPMSELWSRPLPIALLSLAVLWWLVWLPRHGVRPRSWALFRCLLPSWRFFEQIEPVPALRYRVAYGGDDWSDWRDALVVPARRLSSLWLNAAGNLHLASRSLVEHLLADLGDGDELGQPRDELVSYRLVCALVEQRVRAALPPGPALRYQFCLTQGEPAEAPLFLSRVHDRA